MKSWLRYISLGLLAYTLFMAATVPAALIYPYVKDRLLPLNLYGIEGTLWSGQAETADLGTYRLGKLNWRAHPWMLLLGRVELSWSNSGAAGHGQGIVTRRLNGTIQARKVILNLPVVELASLFPNLPLKPAGVLQANFAELEIKGRQLLSAQGSLSWNDAAVLVPQPLKLGKLTINLTTMAGSIKGMLADQGGPLQAQGVLLVKPEGAYQFTGALALRSSAQPQLQQILAFAGTPGPDGKVSISLSGMLSGTVPAIPITPASAKKARVL